MKKTMYCAQLEHTQPDHMQDYTSGTKGEMGWVNPKTEFRDEWWNMVNTVKG